MSFFLFLLHKFEPYLELILYDQLLYFPRSFWKRSRYTTVKVLKIFYVLGAQFTRKY